MKKMSLFKKSVFRNQSLWGYFVATSVSMLAVVVVVFFQNCGAPGFGGDDDGGLDGLTASQATANARFTSAPFPLDYTLNHVAYMSCPMSGDSQTLENSLFSSSTFSVRVGAYNNVPYAQEFGTFTQGGDASSDFQKASRLQAGIRMRPEFLQYLQDQFKRSDMGIIKEALSARLEGLDVQPAIGLVNLERSTMEGGFGWDYGLLRPTLVDLDDPVFLSAIKSAPSLGYTFEYQRQSHFSSLYPGHRSLQASLSWGKSEVDHRLFARELRNNLMVAAGFSSGGADNVTLLLDPKFSLKNNVNGLAGRGYRLNLSTNAAQGQMTSLEARFLVGVEELQIDQRSLQSLSQKENQQWDCFSLMIVRHIDRLDPDDPQNRPYCAGVQNTAVCKGLRNARGPNSSEIRGVRFVCPSQTIGSLNSVTTENGVSVRRNRLRHEMARRVLPPEFWEINTDPHHMCVVGTELAYASGKCYSSGDRDHKKYIQYSLNQELPGGSSLPCGQEGGNECPAYVSICYRKY
jgi:hypothetical protein